RPPDGARARLGLRPRPLPRQPRPRLRRVGGHRRVPPPRLYSGKVRDVYDAGDGRLLFVASDRISAFDVVMEEPIPDKGRVLTAISAFWFDVTSGIIPNHMVSVDVADFPDIGVADLAGRSMVVRRAEM